MVAWRPVRSTTLWMVAVAFSLALNLVFFDLMPRLIASDTGSLGKIVRLGANAQPLVVTSLSEHP